MGKLDDPELLQLAEELASRTGLPAAEAVKSALRRELGVPRQGADLEDRIRRATAIALRCAARPDLDTRTADEILGYDENGLPT